MSKKYLIENSFYIKFSVNRISSIVFIQFTYKSKFANSFGLFVCCLALASTITSRPHHSIYRNCSTFLPVVRFCSFTRPFLQRAMHPHGFSFVVIVQAKRKLNT